MLNLLFLLTRVEKVVVVKLERLGIVWSFCFYFPPFMGDISHRKNKFFFDKLPYLGIYLIFILFFILF